MSDSIYVWRSLRKKHQSAPLLTERERYLAYLLTIGATRQRVRTAASILLNVIHLLGLTELRPVHFEEVTAAMSIGKQEKQFQDSRDLAVGNPHLFRRVAVSWLRFLNALVVAPGPRPPFEELQQHFLHAMRTERGFAESTLRAYGLQTYHFLQWYSKRSTDLTKLTVMDIDEFIDIRRSAGWKPISLVALCKILRTFVGFAESQGWCPAGIPRGIESPRLSSCSAIRQGPPWSVVRRLIKSISGNKPSDFKARAVILLCAIYGLRAIEVARLTLDDLDWRNETITVRRAKRGRIQQFPLQYEVGDAIIGYLRHARPNCSSRNIFLTRCRPYRPLRPHACWDIVSQRMRKLGMGPGAIGPHALRHACATQLLRRGLSLQEIADFLGHRSIRNVSHYAKHDPRSLKEVSNFGLRGVL
jgi:integrase/recombinase XerD